MSKFLTDLDSRALNDEVSILLQDLVFDSDIVGRIIAKAKFVTDFASVPRIPIVYWLWGNRAHREAVIHDFLFRKDALPDVSFDVANKVFLEAMQSTGKSAWIYNPMYWGVCLASRQYFNIRSVNDKPIDFGVDLI